MKDDTKAPEEKYEKEEAIEARSSFAGIVTLFRRDRQGFEYETNPISFVNENSIVVASITEVSNGAPFQGAASMEIHNVVPMKVRTGEMGGRIRVRGFIGFDHDLNFKVSFIVVN